MRPDVESNWGPLDKQTNALVSTEFYNLLLNFKFSIV